MRKSMGRSFGVLAVLAACATAAPPVAIDRQSVVGRHDVNVTTADPYGALSVGNGSFAFNFDVTGLQSFPDYYAKTTPLGILSDWGWHSFPNPDGFSLATFPFKTIAKNGRTFSYPASGTAHPTTQAAYLRANPHRMGLAMIGLEMTKADGTRAALADVQNINQHLDLWNGQVDSAFTLEGQPVKVHTAVAMDTDTVAVRVESPLLTLGRLKIKLRFPYATDAFGPDYNDFARPDAHVTTMTPYRGNGATFTRVADDLRYTARLGFDFDESKVQQTAAHEFTITSPDRGRVDMTVWFSQKPYTADNDTARDVEVFAAGAWHDYWKSGGIIDLSGTPGPQAAELERRLVLSQYVMRVHDAGRSPPQETGLAANSWWGKFHMEMYWWHAAHWALWGHPELLERSLDSLKAMMPANAKLAQLQGCRGVKWPKMTDPSGTESPSGVGPILVWQQPHPIYLAELAWRARRDRATLERYQDVVFATADYMADFVDYDAKRGEYVLGPAVSSGDEKHTDVATNLNPTMELQYWKWTLQLAQQWRTRLGLPPDAKYADVIAKIAKPTVRDGVYPALEIPVETSPAFLTTFMFGAMPGPDVDRDVMRKTLHNIKLPTIQGTVTWGTAMAAMCAARLHEPQRAVDLLAGPYEVNPFRTNGYANRRPDQTPMYMPVNGGWLTAAAIMAAGWDGETAGSPGFPKDWVVRWEGLMPLP